MMGNEPHRTKRTYGGGDPVSARRRTADIRSSSSRGAQGWPLKHGLERVTIGFGERPTPGGID